MNASVAMNKIDFDVDRKFKKELLNWLGKSPFKKGFS